MGSTKSWMPDSGRLWGQKTAGQFESLRTPATLPSLPDTSHLLPHRRRRGLVKISPLLPRPRGKRSWLLLLRAPRPKSWGQPTQVPREEGPAAPSPCLGETCLSWHWQDPGLLSSATTGPGRLPSPAPSLYGTHRPGRDLEAMGMTSLLKHLDPNPWHSTICASFSFGKQGPLRGTSGRCGSPSSSSSPGQKGGQGALWATISQQLLVSKVVVGSRFRAL